MTIDIICADAAEKLVEIADNTIQLTVTSPPYDNLRTYDGHMAQWNEDKWKAIIAELYRVTKEHGVVVWVVGDSTVKGSESGTSFKQALWAKECGFNLHDTMIWNKPNFSNPSKTRYHQTFEYMFIWSKGKPVFHPIRDKKNKYLTCVGRNTMRKANGELVEIKKTIGNEYGMRTNVWNMNTVGQEMMCKTPPHPAMFPYVLAHNHITSWSNPGDIVLDPFMGAGTTALACIELDRSFIGIDIVEDYVRVAAQLIDRAIRNKKGNNK